jgi:hypothetical protein
MSSQVTTLRFIDADTSDEALAIVRVLEECIGLSLSLRSNGDVEVFLHEADAKRLLNNLSNAVAALQRE